MVPSGELASTPPQTTATPLLKMNLETDFTRTEAQSSSPMSSPTSLTRHAQRFAQYKPRTSAGSMSSSFRPKDFYRTNGPNFQASEPPQKQLWREKLRKQVEKRAKRDRQRAHERGRSEEASSGASSDADYDMDDENADSLDDEVPFLISSGFCPYSTVFSSYIGGS
jgi:hypothetical protein